MKDTEQEILKIFQNARSKEFDTTELARKIYPEEYAKIESMLKHNDRQILNEAKTQKFRMHRKLLYYLNKLVESKILNVSRIKEKGEKSFVLSIEEGDITLEKGYKKITITKPPATTNYIEIYEKKDIMKKYEENNWVNKANAILLECPIIGTKLYTTVKDTFRNVNDVIALNDFQHIINTQESLSELLEKFNEDTINFDKVLSLIISLDDINTKMLLSFIKEYARIIPKKMHIIWRVNNKLLQKNSEIMLNIIKEFSKAKIKVNIANTELASSPCFKGRAGMYSFDDYEWEVYSKNIQGKISGVLCSQSSIAINMNRFFEEYKTDAEFRQALINAAKTLLLNNQVQRRKSSEYFKNINTLNAPYQQDFYRFSRNYIRLWNYDWHKDISEDHTLLDLIKSTKEVINNFCISEETIYKSCGIPMKFKIALSSAFRNFDVKFMGERDYKKVNVRGLDDYNTSEIKEFILAREELFELFDGCDRLRIFRTQEVEPTMILREISMMLTTYKIPLFTYDFSTLRGMVKLTNYL